MVPDPSVLWRDAVWAGEHHLNGELRHDGDYQRLLEGEGHTLCHWWWPEVRMGLLVVTAPVFLEHVKGQLRRHELPGLAWRGVTRDGALRDPGAWLR